MSGVKLLYVTSIYIVSLKENIEENNVCVEPCDSAIQTEVSWIKKTIGEFKDEYKKAHEILGKKGEE